MGDRACGIGLGASDGPRLRYHVRSQYGPKERAHHFLGTIDLGESCESSPVWLFGPFPYALPPARLTRDSPIYLNKY
jgi:hypothetical protein